MSASKSGSLGVVVPVDVVAFCLGKTDEQVTAGKFAGTTVIYSDQTTAASQTPAYQGANVSVALDSAAWKPLEAGVHIHWALPDALTHADISETSTDLRFPAAPNRWLVTRMVIKGATPSVTSWVVESDALNPQSPVDWRLPTLPLQPGTSAQDYAYLGQSTPLAQYAPPAPNGPRSFKNATGAELSAVSNGAATFAAYYPDSRTAFGFVDTLSDVSGAANLMYVVTGWFDLPDNDPAHLSRDLAKSHFWKASAQAAYTLYSGLVQDVAWDPQRDYVPDPQPIAAQAAVANTPIEALSAYFRALNHPDLPFFEQLLNAFQEGLLPRFAAQGPGVLAKFAEALHDNTFQAVDAGQIYSLVLTDPDGSRRDATDLPLRLAVALNQLNVKAQALEEVATAVESLQWRMFADWYRYFLADPANNNPIFLDAEDVFEAWADPDTGAGLQADYAAAQTALQEQLNALQQLLSGTPFSLKPSPAPRYWQPTDPAVLLASPELAFPMRYGGDTQYGTDGLLSCRGTDQLVSAVTVAGVPVDGTRFAAIGALPSAKLPYATDCTNLLIEACLLNTSIAATLSGDGEPALQTALEALVDGKDQTTWTMRAGQQPSPVAVAWWGPQNPWLPLFLHWTVNFQPLHATQTDGAMQDYPDTFLTANFTIDSGTGSFVKYTPTDQAGGISVDPGSLNFVPSWSGQSILSPSSADNLATAVTGYLKTTTDTTLQAILQSLGTPTMVQSLSGFTAGLLMQQLIPQLQIAVPANADYLSATLTQWTTGVVGASYHVGPKPNWQYNPIRAGWFTLSLQAIDVFGQTREISLKSMAIAESMTALDKNQQPVPNVAYAAPRLAQPARLLFDWISAGAGGLVEMNDHPAMSPICGWLLPNHLNGGFFLYDAVGRPLGSLRLNGDQSDVVWLAAPGDDATINDPIEQVLADVNPVFTALALHLKSDPKWFLAFWTAVDQVHGGISPDLLATNAGLPVLIGRPVAVAQAALRLDLRGRPALNQSFGCLVDKNWLDTDNAFDAVKCPVLLGDADKLDDGLVGFFLPAGSGGGYDLKTFFSAGAPADPQSGVVLPTQETILLTPTPTLDDPEPPPVARQTLQALLLVDPRAPVHATTGILPTQSLRIPPDLAADAMSRLEMSFPVAPILKPVGGLALPIPREPGYAVSFMEQNAGGGTHWVAYPDIRKLPAKAVWDYTPQTLTEGWLRLNPTLLAFDLLNGDAKALVVGGTTQQLTLRVTNRKPGQITFLPGTIVAEGVPPPKGSIFYIHFGVLVDQGDVDQMTFTANGWTFLAAKDDTYGSYWAATSTAPVSLLPGESFEIAIAGLKAVANAVQAQVYADYYGVDGVSDGVFADLVTIQKPSF